MNSKHIITYIEWACAENARMTFETLFPCCIITKELEMHPCNWICAISRISRTTDDADATNNASFNFHKVTYIEL